MALPTFLSLPERRPKPRQSGLTHVIDRGASVATTASVLATAGEHIDLWKFGWGTAYLDPGLPDKLRLLAEGEVGSCIGGTLMEIAWAQGKTEDLLDWAAEAGFRCVEISRGVAPMPRAAKQELIRRAVARFEVLSEAGRKDPADELSPAEWSEEVAADLDAGARWVIIEGRESGTVGLYTADGLVRSEVVDAALKPRGPEAVIFESPRKDQQAWLIRHLGPQVNLGNIALEDVLAVETLRRGLRADTFDLLPREVPL